MTTITNSKVFSSSYTVLKDFISANVTDPRSRFKKQWIHPSVPNQTDQKFDGYPFITISLDVSEANPSFDRSSNKIFRAFVTVYSDQSTEVDSLSDDIVDKLKNESLTDNLNEFKSIEVVSSPYGYDLIGSKKIHKRIIGLRGKKRL